MVREPMHLGGGTWKRLTIQTPTGCVEDLYISPDKSPAQTVRDMASKRLKDIIEGELAGGALHLVKRDGAMFVDWQPLVTVEVKGAKETMLVWTEATLQKVGLGKDEIEGEFSRKWAGNSGGDGSHL